MKHVRCWQPCYWSWKCYAMWYCAVGNCCHNYTASYPTKLYFQKD